MNRYDKPVRTKLTKAGCFCVLQRRGTEPGHVFHHADHEVWYSPVTNKHITVPIKIRSRSLAVEILKVAGLSGTV